MYIALMASKHPTCTTLPAALCEKHFSRRELRPSIPAASLLEGILASPGCVLAGFGLLLAVSWPLLASPGGLWDGSVVPFGLCYAAVGVFGPRRHASNLDLATFGVGPGWIFYPSHVVLAHALGPSRWIALHVPPNSIWRRPGSLGQPFRRSGEVFFHGFSWFAALARARGNNTPIL